MRNVRKTKRRRASSDQSFEHAAKMAVIRKSAIHGDLCNRTVVGNKRGASTAYSDLMRVLADRLTKQAPEFPRKMHRVNADAMRHVLNRQRLRIVRTDELYAALEPLRNLAVGSLLDARHRTEQFPQNAFETKRRKRSVRDSAIGSRHRNGEFFAQQDRRIRNVGTQNFLGFRGDFYAKKSRAFLSDDIVMRHLRRMKSGLERPVFELASLDFLEIVSADERREKSMLMFVFRQTVLNTSD